MGRTHNDMQELLGAYALNALEGDEIEALELHISDCPKCRAELRDHRETAAMLAHAGAPAPAGLWERIAASLDEAPEDADTVFRMPVGLSGTPRKAATNARWRKGVAAVAAVAAAIGVLGVVDRSMVRRDPSVETIASIAFADPDSKLVKLRSADGEQTIDAVLTEDGRGYVLHGKLNKLESSKTYQLWAIVSGQPPISLGLLGRNPKAAEFAAHLSPSQLAISIEKAGGAQAPSLPVLSGVVS